MSMRVTWWSYEDADSDSAGLGAKESESPNELRGSARAASPRTSGSKGIHRL